PSTSLVTATGNATNTRGAGRPAAAAAAPIVGAMWSRTVAVPVIHVIVPSATVPASFSIADPSAATSTGGAAAPFTPTGWKALHVTRSPANDTVSPRSKGISADRYSFM